MLLVESFLALLVQLGSSLTAPSLHKLTLIVSGWLMARRRTLSHMLLISGAAEEKHFTSFYRFFSKARWSLDTLGLALFGMLLPLLPREGSICLAADDTLARKRGLKVFGAAMHRDPLASSRKRAVMSWGHNWVLLAVWVQLPFCPGRYFSLPVLFRLYRSHKAVGSKRLAHRTRPELLVELLHLLCSRYPRLRFHLYADSTYGGQSVLAHLPANCDLTSRLPLDARLYSPPPPRPLGTRGRPRRRGEPLPSPRAMLEQRGHRVVLAIYGRRDKARIVETVARWHAVPERPVRVVAVEPLSGRRPLQAFYSTDIVESAQQVLVGYSGRWSVEEAIQGSKSHLGFEEPQAWSKKAVQRTAPWAMLLYSLVVLWFTQCGHSFYQPPYRPWFPRKTQPSFADMLDTLRRVCLERLISANLPNTEGLDNPFHPMRYVLQSAA